MLRRLAIIKNYAGTDDYLITLSGTEKRCRRKVSANASQRVNGPVCRH